MKTFDDLVRNLRKSADKAVKKVCVGGVCSVQGRTHYLKAIAVGGQQLHDQRITRGRRELKNHREVVVKLIGVIFVAQSTKEVLEPQDGATTEPGVTSNVVAQVQGSATPLVKNLNVVLTNLTTRAGHRLL